ncbi:hypothetical protein ACFC26_37065 [Kitasatospora purpeofusca]|uniref:hypothetical protein n=1 Tax=Kitasatospora purpeofusca TaxID=67352 RepID=UPI0035D76F4F
MLSMMWLGSGLAVTVMDLRWCGTTMQEATVDAAAWLAMVGAPLLVVVATAWGPEAGRRRFAMARCALRLVAFIARGLTRLEGFEETQVAQQEKAADRQYM